MVLGLVGVAILGSRIHPVGPPPEPPKSERQETSAPALQPVVGNGYGSFSVERAPDSHFYADAQVNGATIRFMIDTGASSVVLTREDAQRAGLAQGDYSAKGVGAGGEVKLMPVTIDRLALGPLSANNVPGMVAEKGLPISLLGQSYLSRVGSVAISQDRLTLR